MRERFATLGPLEAGANEPEFVIRRPDALTCVLDEAWAGAGLGGSASMGRPSSQKPGPRGKDRRTPRRSKLHKVNAAGLLDPRHGSDPSGGDVLEDHTNLNMDGLRARTPRPGPVTMRVMGENVAAVGVCAIHPAYSSGTRISAGSRHE